MVAGSAAGAGGLGAESPVHAVAATAAVASTVAKGMASLELGESALTDHNPYLKKLIHYV